jgi:Ner family transcriptional regulator
MPQKPWTRAKIRYELDKRGWSNLREVDVAHDLPIGTTATVLTQPHARGEQVVAEILGVPPQTVWPDRYDASGKRLKPQPLNQIKGLKALRHRQKSAAA